VRHPQSAEAKHSLEKHIPSHGETSNNGHEIVDYFAIE
jgi:hypothetical protein